MSSELYKRDLFLNKDVPFLYRTHIYEYDMHHAGISITREYELLPEEAIDKIEKKARNKKDIATLLGLVQRENQDFKEALSKGFVRARKDFFEANSLEDTDILSIKKDAIFTLRKCEFTEFGEIKFNNKNTYSSYVYIDSTFGDSIEIYYSEENGVDVKGIDDRVLFYHKDYILDFLMKYFYKVENDNEDNVLKYLKVWIDRYKEHSLDVGYYRPFDRKSVYCGLDDGIEYSDIFSVEQLNNVDTRYNLMNLLIPLVKTLL